MYHLRNQNQSAKFQEHGNDEKQKASSLDNFERAIES